MPPQLETRPKYNMVLGSKVRSRNGCINCKKRKKKCDEQFPTCGLCARRDVTCFYENFRSTTVSKGKQNNSIKVIKEVAPKHKVLDKTKVAISLEQKTQANVKQEGQSLENAFTESGVIPKIPEVQTPSTGSPLSLEEMLVRFSSTPGPSGVVSSSKPGAHARIEQINDSALQTRNKQNDDNEEEEEEEECVSIPDMKDFKPSVVDLTGPPVSSSFPFMSDVFALSPSDLISNTHLPSVTMSSPVSLFLDSTGMQYLQYFEEKVSRLLCIDNNVSNYFIKTFLQISFTEESISNALACWGGVFLSKEGLRNQMVKRHFDKSVALFKDFPLISDFHYYVLLCYYQIMIGIQVCSGDIKYWSVMFENCFSLIYAAGGVKALLDKYSSSNDIKWLISNFQYHDVLSSDAFIYGTKFPMEEYQLNFVDYGVDPYQGCSNEIVTMVGEILNEKCRLTGCNDAKEWMEIFNILSMKLETCEPIEYQLRLVDGSAKDTYIIVFQLYKICATIILLTYFKKLTPCALDIQLLIPDALDYMEQLLDTNVVSCFTFPALIVGTNVLGSSRLKYMRYLDKLLPIYNVGNLVRTKYIVMEYWERNPVGNSAVDWIDIVKEWDWKVSLT